MQSFAERFTIARRRLFEPVDAASLAVFRIAFGVLMLWEMWYFFEGNRLGELFLKPPFLFKFYGFGWVHPWPGIGLYVHFGVMALLAVLIAVGQWYRIAIVLFGLGFAYVFLLDQGIYLNHFYLICLVCLLMSFVAANRVFSVDAWQHPSIRVRTVPAWMLWMMRAQIGIVYFYAGLAKLNSDWLGGEPMRSFLAVRGDAPIIGPYVESPVLISAFACGGLLFDLLVVPALLWRRTRAVAFACALVFHLLNAWQFDIDVFPWFMIAATTLFFSPDWPRRVLARWTGPIGEEAPPALPEPSTRRRRVTVALLGIYFAVQLLVPLRHVLYPGYTLWTMEGHRFAWRMLLGVKRTEVTFVVTAEDGDRFWVVDPKQFLPPEEVALMNTSPRLTEQYAATLREEWRKNGFDRVIIRREPVPTLFRVTEPKTGQAWTLSPVELGLPPTQADNMSGTPDMILQFAHWIARRMAELGHDTVEVRADGYVSLHGRPYQRLVDPDVDLAAQPRTLGPASWIVPLQHPLPKREESPAS